MARSSKITNQEFADRVDCDHSMASLLLNGKRTPSDALMERIAKEFGISWRTLVVAKERGAEAVGKLLSSRCMPKPPSERTVATSRK